MEIQSHSASRVGVQLYFSAQEPPELRKVVFTVAESNGGSEEFERFRKAGRSDTDGFEWKGGTVGFVLALLACKLNSRKNEGIYDFKGASRSSPAASARGALEKMPWLLYGFGYNGEDVQDPIAKHVFTVAENKAAKSVSFQIHLDWLAPEKISVFRGDPPNELATKQLKRLQRAVEEQWKPHRRQKQTALGEMGHGPEPVPAERDVVGPPANVSTSDISRDRYSAMAHFAEAESCICAGQLEQAGRACLESAGLFERLHDDGKVVQAQLLLVEIHCLQGLQGTGLAKLVNPMKAIVERGKARDIVELFLYLWAQVPEAISLQDVDRDAPGLREAIRLGLSRRPINKSEPLQVLFWLELTLYWAQLKLMAIEAGDSSRPDQQVGFWLDMKNAVDRYESAETEDHENQALWESRHLRDAARASGMRRLAFVADYLVKRIEREKARQNEIEADTPAMSS